MRSELKGNLGFLANLHCTSNRLLHTHTSLDDVHCANTHHKTCNPIDAFSPFFCKTSFSSSLAKERNSNPFFFILSYCHTLPQHEGKVKSHKRPFILLVRRMYCHSQPGRYSTETFLQRAAIGDERALRKCYRILSICHTCGSEKHDSRCLQKTLVVKCHRILPTSKQLQYTWYTHVEAKAQAHVSCLSTPSPPVGFGCRTEDVHIYRILPSWWTIQATCVYVCSLQWKLLHHFRPPHRYRGEAASFSLLRLGCVQANGKPAPSSREATLEPE